MIVAGNLRLKRQLKRKKKKEIEIDEIEKCLDKVFPHDSRFFFLESRLVKDNSSSIAPNFSN